MRRALNPHAVPLIYIAVAAAGALAAFVAGTNVAVLIAGTVRGGGSWSNRNRRLATQQAAGRIDVDRRWWKFVLAGPCIVAAVIFAAGVGVDAWFIGVISVLVAFVLTGIGLLLGLLRIANRRSRAGTLPT